MTSTTLVLRQIRVRRRALPQLVAILLVPVLLLLLNKFIRITKQVDAFFVSGMYQNHRAQQQHVQLYASSSQNKEGKIKEDADVLLQQLQQFISNNATTTTTTTKNTYQQTSTATLWRTLKGSQKYNQHFLTNHPLCEALVHACWLSEDQETVIDMVATTLKLLSMRTATTNSTTKLPSLWKPTAKHWTRILQTVHGETNIVFIFKAITQMNKNTTIHVRHCTIAMRRFHNAQASKDLLLHMAHNIDTTGRFRGLRFQHPDRLAVSAALTACSDEANFDVAMQILNAIKSEPLTIDHHRPSRTNLLLDSSVYDEVLASCSDPEKAEELLREMRLSRRNRYNVVRPTAKTYARAIAVCRRAKNVQKAMEFLERAVDDGITLDSYLYTAAMWSAAESKEPKVAEKLLEEMMIEHDLSPTVVTFNAIIAAHAKLGNVQAATSFYERLLESNLVPNTSTFLHLSIAARNTLSLEERLRHLRKIYDTTLNKDWKLETVAPIIEALIHAYGSRRDFKAATCLFDTVRDMANIKMVQSYLFACSMAIPSQWKEAVIVLHSSDVSIDQTSPKFIDPDSLALAVTACSKADQWEEAFQLLGIYCETPLSLYAANTLLSCCGRCGRADLALSFLDRFSEHGLTPDGRTYRTVMIACNQAEHMIQKGKEIQKACRGNFYYEYWEAAVSLLRRMREDGITPDKQTYSSAISACEAAGQWQRALAILQDILDDSKGNKQDLNIYYFNACISACEKGEAWVEALDIYERMMADDDLPLPNEITVMSLVLALGRAGQKELAQSKYDEAFKLEIINPWTTTRLRGKDITALDLHSFNQEMAAAAVRSYVDKLLHLPVEALGDRLIITGKGLRSQNEPVLSSVVMKVLKDDYGINGEVDPTNLGRIMITGKSLRDRVKAAQ